MDRPALGDAAEACGWLVIAPTGLVMLTQAVGWDGGSTVAVAQAVTPLTILPTLIVAAAAAWTRRTLLVGVSSAVMCGLLVLAHPLAFPVRPAAPAENAHGLSIASINLLFDNSEVAELADDLAARDPDVIALSEYVPAHRRVLDDHPLSQRYRHRIDLDESFGSGMALWSRFPIVDRAPDVLGSRGIDVTIVGPDGPVRIIAVHPRTPISDFAGWRATLRAVAARNETEGPPTAVVGDLNASYWHPAFRDMLDRGFSDAHLVSGRGWSVSWPIDRITPAFVRLDHALVDEKLSVIGLVDFDPPGSDHRGVVVTVAPTEVRPRG